MPVKVIIVGGGISGLSLASMLEKLGIDFVVLEGYRTIAPQAGASIGMMPNGLQILDQLGCFEKLRDLAGDCYLATSMRGPDGKELFRTGSVSISRRLEERTGYPSFFIDRQMVLQALYESIQDKTKVLPNKRVTRADIDESGMARVLTADGQSYTGDIVIGADGIHSCIRDEMWRMATEAGQDVFGQSKGSKLKSSTKCIFGISKIPDNFPPATQQITMHDGWCYLVVGGPGDRLYWFLFQCMPTVYGKDIPRWTKKDEEDLASVHMQDKVTETTTFGDIYNNRRFTTLVSLEEYIFPRWHFKRFITIGDSGHKVHPITALGGNGALESAATLVNALMEKLKEPTNDLSAADVEEILGGVRDCRYSRVDAIVKEGELVQSLVSQQMPCAYLITKYIFPLIGDRFMFRGLLASCGGATRVDRLLPPKLAAPFMSGMEASHKGTGFFRWGPWALLALGGVGAGWFFNWFRV